MDKQSFLEKLKELKSSANAELREVLKLWLVEGKSDEEIAIALGKTARTTGVRKIGEICKHFGTDAKGKKEQRQHLVLLFRKFCSDFEVHPSIYPEWVAGSSGDRPPTPQPDTSTPDAPRFISPDFIGRDDEVAFIHHLTAQGAKCILILAPGGTGKTELAKNYLKQAFDSYIEFPIAKERRNIASIASLVEEKLRGLHEEPGREFMVSLDRLKRKLQQERIGVLIDNLEPALDGNGRFVEEHRDYIELLRVLTDSSLRSTTLITSRESLNEGLDIQTLNLGGLKVPVWQIFFSQQGINADTSVLAEVHKAYGGNALAMKILCDPIKRFHDGDLAAYWQTSKTESGLVVVLALENLIREQFDRLQSNSPEAYKLLCRMGCFRYQDVPTVPSEGLISLLWDVSQEKRSRVIISLRNCPLIELEKGEYFLHSIIRAEAISRLRASSEWEETNRKAAEFWIDSVKSVENIDDAVNAFEAFYHYISIDSFGEAARVLTGTRESGSEWEKLLDDGEHLAEANRRLALHNKIISAIELVLPRLSKETKVENSDNLYCISILYKCWADNLWLSGKINDALKKLKPLNFILNKHYLSLATLTIKMRRRSCIYKD
jgi:hypothetical protein